MDSGTVKAIQDALTPLADKLGQGASAVYQAYMLHAYAVGVGYLVAAFFGIVNLIAWVLYAKKHTVKTDGYGGFDEGLTVVLWGTLTAVATVLSVVGLSVGVMHLVAPQYYAINDLLCTVKDCSK